MDEPEYRLEPLPYHVELRDYLKSRERELRDWFVISPRVRLAGRPGAPTDWYHQPDEVLARLESQLRGQKCDDEGAPPEEVKKAYAAAAPSAAAPSITPPPGQGGSHG